VLILAVDTSSLAGSLAVLEREALVGVVGTRSEETYSSRLFRHLKLLLDDLKLALDRFDLFAVAAGPGSFTGLRVGLAAVKGWAEAYSKPIAAISALEAVAAEARSGERLLVPVMDARRGQLYVGLYERGERRLKPRGDEVVLAPEEFLKWLAQSVSRESFAFVSPTPEAFAGAVAGSMFRDRTIETIAAVLAPAIGRLGFERARAGEVVDALHLDANYIRRSDAELLWKP